MKKNKSTAAKKFSYKWNAHGDENQETYKFWTALLRDIFEIENPEELFKFQEPVKFDGRIHNVDLILPKTKVLIEQKSFGMDLTKKYRQSDGEFLTPYEQAKRYADNLPPELKPRFIITCNFAEFQIYDLKQPFLYYIIEHVKKFGRTNTENILRDKELRMTEFKPVTIELQTLQDDYKRLAFLVDAKAEHLLPEMQVAIAAAKNLKNLYQFFETEYKKNYPAENYLDALNSLAVKLLYCFYASDAHIFEGENTLQTYLKDFDLKNRNKA